MFAWNNLAKLAVFVGFVAGIASYFALATLRGETDVVKGIAILVGGVTVIAFDVAYRHRNNRDAGAVRYWHPDAGGALLILPIWVVGIMAIVGGASVIFSGR